MANYISFVNIVHLGRDHLPSLFGRLNKKVTSLAKKDVEEEKSSIIEEIVKHAEKKEACSEGSVYDDFGSKSSITLKIVDSRGDYLDNALLVENPEQPENGKCPKRPGISVRFIEIFGRLTGCLFRRNPHENDDKKSGQQIHKEKKLLEKSERKAEKSREKLETERKLEKQNQKQLKRIEKKKKKQRKLEKKVQLKTQISKKVGCDEYVNETKRENPMFEVLKNSTGFGLKDLNQFEVSDEDLAEAGSSKQTFVKCSQCYGSSSQQNLDQPSTSSGVYHSTSVSVNRMYFTNIYSC